MSVDIIKREPDPGLLQPDLPHDVVEEGHHRNPAVGVTVLKLGEGLGGEVRQTLLAAKAPDFLELVVVENVFTCKRNLTLGTAGHLNIGKLRSDQSLKVSV